MRFALAFMALLSLSVAGLCADLCQVRAPDTAGLQGGEVVVPVLLTTDFPVPAFSFGVVHAPDWLSMVEITPGAAAQALRNGQGASYFYTRMYDVPVTCPVGAADTVVGGTCACLADFDQLTVIPAGEDREIAKIRVIVEAAGDTTLTIRECLGSPVVGLRVVKDDLPVQGCQWQGATVSAEVPAARVSIADGPAVLPAAAFTREVLLDNALTHGVGGFQFAVAFTGTLVALTAIDYEGCAAMEALNGGAGPDFFDVTLQAGGWTCGADTVHGGAVACVVDDAWAATIPAGTGVAIARLSFTANDQGVPGTTAIAIPTEGCIPADRPARVRFTESVAVTPEVQGTTVEVLALRFVRADVNQDLAIDIADAVAVLGVLFAQKPIACRDSGDSNDDGKLDIADAIYTLAYLFAQGSDPHAPFPDCGLPAVTKLGCARFDRCNQ